MKQHGFFYCIALIIITLSILGITFYPTSAADTISSTSKSWIDNFDSEILNSRWSWVREDPAYWSLTSNPGYLHIIAQEGGLIGPGGDAKNILLTTAPFGNYQITSLVTIAPVESFQGAAVYIYQDDDNYIKISRRYGGTGQMITYRQEVEGVHSAYNMDETATTVYLRISRAGDLYDGTYSVDGATWFTIGQFSQVFDNPKIGLGSESGPSLMEIPSDYDFFQLDDYTNYIYLPCVLNK